MKIRIITGDLKHKNLFAPTGKHKIRSTTSLVKKAVIDIFQRKIEDSSVLDLFAGIGNVGIEFLSNRAKKAVFIEMNFHNAAIIRRNLEELKFPEEKYSVINDTAEKGLARLHEQFDFIFMDPPYRQNMVRDILARISDLDIIHGDTVIIAEHSQQEKPEERIGRLFRTDSRKYGSTILDFYKKQSITSDG
ncbi:MAG: 16S rRNA (guanine(966)-N(2))-methyltransferase RsmD [bacterium]|nr:16S rRNA (guanine(966)-N(2))-methyltransferase RsmD [bacterium]